jgi:hypothetical protein
MSQVPKGKPIDADRATTEVPKRELTDAERAALDKQALRQKEQPPVPRFNMVADDRGFRIEQNHPDKAVAYGGARPAHGNLPTTYRRNWKATGGDVSPCSIT